MSLSVLVMTLGKECVKSTQGDIRTPPAGRGSPRSRRMVRRARERPPPAESPAMTIFDGDTGL